MFMKSSGELGEGIITQEQFVRGLCGETEETADGW